MPHTKDIFLIIIHTYFLQLFMKMMKNMINTLLNNEWLNFYSNINLFNERQYIKEISITMLIAKILINLPLILNEILNLAFLSLGENQQMLYI